MRKFLTLMLVAIVACLLGGVYGVFHDQITYSISAEYYTKFKFYLFGLMDVGNEAIFPNPRLQVAVVGFLASWWMGIPIGIILGLVGLAHSGWKPMLEITLKAFLITVAITFITGLIGLADGFLFLSEKPRDKFWNWFLPDNLIDFRSFVAVGSMHNFSYLGGLIGLLGGIVYSLFRKFRPHGKN